MHWLHDNWLTVLPWALYALSEVMPLLPNKAQSVIGAVLNDPNEQVQLYDSYGYATYYGYATKE